MSARSLAERLSAKEVICRRVAIHVMNASRLDMVCLSQFLRDMQAVVTSVSMKLFGLSAGTLLLAVSSAAWTR